MYIHSFHKKRKLVKESDISQKELNNWEPVRLYWKTRISFSNKLYVNTGFPGDSDGKESTCNVGDLGSIQKILWRRAWQPIPVFLSGEAPWINEPGRLQSMGSQSIGHN